MMKLYVYAFLVLSVIQIYGCKKGFLEAKPDKALQVPVTLNDFQNLLNNSYGVFNGNIPFLTLISSDDIRTAESGLLSAEINERNSYLWSDDPYEANSVSDWNTSYKQVFYANVVMDGLIKLNGSSDQLKFNMIKGTALFYRAFAFYNLAQQFAQPYVINSTNQMPGIPIKLSSDVNIKSKRGTLEDTYRQICEDLKVAVEILPEKVSVKTSPSKAAALALLARVYQTMGKYEEAAKYADKCLTIYNTLIDFNDFPATGTVTFSAFPNINAEVIYFSTMSDNSFLVSTTQTFIDSTLYASYEQNDLRKTRFFRDRTNNNFTFKGSYARSSVFGGIATDEVYLIRAECLARLGNIESAMSDLNLLLKKRWTLGKYLELFASNQDDALNKILLERRKELVYRNLRWTDLRRLNQYHGSAKRLKRVVNQKEYILEPNSPKYTFLIPLNEIQNNLIDQNPR